MIVRFWMLWAALPLMGQPAENWNLYFQATSIGQYHGTFPSPYQGPLSLENRVERDVSLTSTLFLGFRLGRDTQVYIDPEIAGGRGFSHVSGLANSSNGELPRVASATPKPYLARAYITHDFGLGDARESLDPDTHQLGGSRPMTRYSITIGRFTLTDFFDNNRYSHDPRTQFLGWAAMYNGAWDYPADVRGYTWGWMHEFHTRSWSFRYASAAEPRVANGPRFDRRLFRDRGDVVEVERRYTVRGNPGALRVLAYGNHARAGTYNEAVNPPDVTLTRRPGTVKYGLGASFEQQVAKDLGVFARWGWNDGKTESFAFTVIDRLAGAGVSVGGARWRRSGDTAATLFTAGGISDAHAAYLGRGGLDFLIGDGRLRYGPERVWESYYDAHLWRGLNAAFDVMHINNPAYNRDRGPLWIQSIRLHLEMNLKTKPF